MNIRIDIGLRPLTIPNLPSSDEPPKPRRFLKKLQLYESPLDKLQLYEGAIEKREAS